MSKSLPMREWALSEKIMVSLGKDEKKGSAGCTSF